MALTGVLGDTMSDLCASSYKLPRGFYILDYLGRASTRAEKREFKNELEKELERTLEKEIYLS